MERNLIDSPEIPRFSARLRKPVAVELANLGKPGHDREPLKFTTGNPIMENDIPSKDADEFFVNPCG
jgi:hypothetical protein